MIRVLFKLILITLLVSAGVYFWYGRMEKQLRQGTAASEKSRAGVAPITAANQDAAVAPPREADPGTVDFQVIIKRNIFESTLEAVKPVKTEVVEEVAPTKLNLTLLGTVTGNDQDARAIIIDNKEKRQDIFQIGDAVQGAFIESIDRGKITLDVNGRIEALLIKDREGGGPGPPNVPPSSNRQVKSSNPRQSVQRKSPRVRPSRRISFRQDPEEGPNARPEMVEEGDAGIEDGAEPDLTDSSDGGDEEIPAE
jgi:type II secretory pathway component PulC